VVSTNIRRRIRITPHPVLRRILNLKTSRLSRTRRRRLAPLRIQPINLTNRTSIATLTLQHQPRDISRFIRRIRRISLFTPHRAPLMQIRVQVECRGRDVGEVVVPAEEEVGGGENIGGIRDGEF
jgi:hypothetical protein